MARTTPIVRGKLLHYRQRGQEGTLIVEPVEWYCWLDTVSHFCLQEPAKSNLATGEVAGTGELIAGAEVFAAAWAKGCQMTPEQAFAMRDVPPARLSPGIADDLSARELEVLRLLAQGLTNDQIAERLVISPRTVNAHLRSIYTKLAVTSRTAATRYAIAHQLI